MIAALLITLRETLEASLVVGIILAYLEKTDNKKHGKWIWYAVLSGILASILFAYLFNTIGEGFTGQAEKLYEGVTMVLAAGLLTWMILWMLTQRKKIRENLENKVQAHMESDHPLGLFFLVFVSVIREGIETVIFLQAASKISEESGMSQLTGGGLGIVIAIVLSYLLFKGMKRIPLRKFFTATSVLLILFAAGLFAHGIHEFQEAGVVPIVTEHLWDWNPEVVEEGVYPVWHEKGAIGGILKGLFGYNGNPSLIEVISYWVYLFVIAGVWWRIEKKNS